LPPRNLLLLNRLKGINDGAPVLDGISVSLIIFNILITAYFATVGTNIDTEIALTSIFMAFLTLSGLTIHILFFGKPKIENFITTSQAFEIAAASIFGVFAVGIMQLISRSLYPFSYQPVLGLWSAKLMLANIAIGEETFIRFGVQPALSQQFKKMNLPSMYAVVATIIVILMTNAIFGVFHYVYYGTPSVLFAVFISGVILSIQLVITNRFSIPLLTHVFVNIM
jgi:membrane protease YdiL (CAAX protease family)